MTDLPPELPLLLGAVRGGRLPRRDRLGRTRATEEEEDRGGDAEDDHGEEPRPSTSTSALGVLLRHEPTLPHQALVNHPGWLSWISYNRVWLVPYASAVFVVLLEVLVGLFAERGLPPAAHAALALFWVFAVGRGTARLEQQSRREEKIRSMAEMLGLPEEILRDEFAEFMAQRKGDHDAKR